MDGHPLIVITSYSIHYTKLYDFPSVHDRSRCMAGGEVGYISQEAPYNLEGGGALQWYEVRREHAERCKSIIIDALGLIAGGRGSADLIRYGCEKAEMEASFDLPPAHSVWTTLADFGISASSEELLIIRRERNNFV